MGLLSPKEYSEFRISLSSKKLPELTKLFNSLEADRKRATLSDNTRGKAAEKAGLVQAEITRRKHNITQG